LTARLTRAAIVVVTIAAACLWTGCKATPAASRRDTIWRPVGTWSGTGRLQSESWPSDSGAMRIRWTTTHASAGSVFQLTIHSAISGRPMQVVVDETGEGSGTAFFSDDPRVFFAVVDAKNIEWTFTIEEPVDVIITPK
jgi:hypothetical protein